MRRNSLSMPTSQRSGNVFRNSHKLQQQRPKHAGAYINPQKFVNKALAPQDQIEYLAQHSFSDFNLDSTLYGNIVARGYTEPTPIQDQTIGPVLAGQDLVGLANTGTGKTAAFIIPLIVRLRARGGMALIMAPTRELAVQINDEFRSFARGLGLSSALCVGGASLSRQIETLRRNPQVIIGTPGRLKDLINQRALRLGSTNLLILDEADRMLDMGFIRDIRAIVSELPTERQSLCFSATMTPEINRLIGEFLIDPVTISVRTAQTSDHVEQDVIRAVSKEHKLEILQDLLGQPGFEKVLVFGQTKWGVQRLADTLTKEGIRAEAIHGNKSQAQRQRALDAFKANKVQVLVATDVAARGLDIPNVTHVINFDQPNTYDDYIHRIGRTGRAGNQGQALTFVS